jgi:Protein of unknown function (DUF732)
MTYVPPSRPPKYRSSKRAWILVGILALTGVIGLAIFAVVVSRPEHNLARSAGPGPATSEITCPGRPVRPDVNPDCYFLNMMETRNITSPDGAQGLIRQAHALCAAMDQAAAAGQTPSVATLPMLRREHPEWSIQDAAFFGGISQAAYCSWNVRQ